MALQNEVMLALLMACDVVAQPDVAVVRARVKESANLVNKFLTLHDTAKPFMLFQNIEARSQARSSKWHLSSSRLPELFRLPLTWSGGPCYLLLFSLAYSSYC
jgi:hypothetical protein